MFARSLRSVIAASLVLIASVMWIVGASGCTSPDGYTTFVAAADVAANETIGPRYAVYVEADPTLTPDQKASYLGELQAFRSVVAEANKDNVSARGQP